MLHLGVVRPRPAAALVGGPRDAPRGRVPPHVPVYGPGGRTRCAGSTSTTQQRSTPGRLRSRRRIAGLFRLEAVASELVAVEVADIAGIGVGPEAARPDRALILPAGRERGLMKTGDSGAAWGLA